MMNPIKRFFLICSFTLVFFVSCFLLWISNNHTIPIMMYHNVDVTHKGEATFITPEIFEKQMKFLKDHRYRVLGLGEYLNAIENEKKLPKRTVVISFDDGNENNYTQAFKILKKYNYPAIIFMPSGFVGKEEFLNEKQLKEMMAQNITVGSHSKLHKYLPDLTTKELEDEIVNSKKDLEDLLGGEVKFFAYPIGGFNDEIKDIVKSAGYKAACATNRGFDKLNKDLYELNRIRFSNNDKQWFQLWGKLSGYYNLFRKPKNPY